MEITEINLGIKNKKCKKWFSSSQNETVEDERHNKDHEVTSGFRSTNSSNDMNRTNNNDSSGNIN